MTAGVALPSLDGRVEFHPGLAGIEPRDGRPGRAGAVPSWIAAGLGIALLFPCAACGGGRGPVPLDPARASSAEAAGAGPGSGASRAARVAEFQSRLEESQRLSDVELRTAVYSYHEAFPCTTNAGLDFADLETFQALYPDSFWVTTRIPSNADGKLAWEASRHHLALVSLYLATRDPAFLRRSWDWSRAILELRDDRLGLPNFRGEVLPAWGSTRYGTGRRTHYLVHSALILEPILETLALLAGAHPEAPGPELEVAWAQRAERAALLEACGQTLALHARSYVPGPEPGQAHLVHRDEEEDRRDLLQPFNRLIVQAWDLTLYSLLAGAPEARTQAECLVRFFRARSERTPSGAMIWGYEAPRIYEGQPVLIEPVGDCDDVSHAFYTVEPMPKLVRAGVVLEGEDLVACARTLCVEVYREEHGVFFSRIGCRLEFTPHVMRNLPGWLCLSEADPCVYPRLAEFVHGNLSRPDPLFLAYLIRFRPR